MTKDQALQLIQDLATRHNGKVSWRTFLSEAGIPAQRIRRATWFCGWNQLLEESGLATSEFLTPRTPDDVIASKVADLILRLRK